MNVRVYGTGCKACKDLLANAVKVFGEGVEYVDDLGAIAAAGVMALPALEVDGKVVSGGKPLRADEMARLALACGGGCSLG